MKCEVCNRQIEKNNNRHHYYLFHDSSYSHKYDDYSKYSHPDDVEAKYDVMVCHECFERFGKKEEKINIPTHIPNKQLKNFLISTLKKRRKI